MSVARLIPVLLCSVALVGCEGASEPEFKVPDTELNDLQAGNIQNGNPLLGSWILTGAVRGDDELVFPPGFSLVLNFWDDGTHSMAATNTSDNFVCELPQTSCTINGTYEYTLTTITFDEEEGPEPGPETVLYVFCRGRLIFMEPAGDDDGIRLTFKRTRRDCWAQDCA